MVAGEGVVHKVEKGSYTHEVRLRIGEGPMTPWARAERVYAFTALVKEE